MMQDVREALADADISVRGTITGPDASRVQQVLSARRAIHAFLSNPSTTSARRHLRTIATHFANHRFDTAEDVLEDLADLPAVGRVTTFGDAFRRTPLNFREQFASDPDQPAPVFSVPRTLPGYAGRVPTSTERARLLAWSSFLSRDNEQRFRIGLIRAEAAAGQRKFVGAVTEYEKLLDSPAGFSKAQLKFVALRVGLTHVAAGDARLPSARRLNTLTRFVALASYRNAIQAVTRQQVSAPEPAARPDRQLRAEPDARRSRRASTSWACATASSRCTGTSSCSNSPPTPSPPRDAVEKFERTRRRPTISSRRRTRDALRAGDRPGRRGDRPRPGATSRRRRRTGSTSRSRRSRASRACSRRRTSRPSSSSPPGWPRTPVLSGVRDGRRCCRPVAGHMARQHELEFQLTSPRSTRRSPGWRARSPPPRSHRQPAGAVPPGQARVSAAGGSTRTCTTRSPASTSSSRAAGGGGIRYAYLYERALAFFLGKPASSTSRWTTAAPPASLRANEDGKLITAADRLNEDVQLVTAELARIGPEDVRHAFTEPPFSLAREFPVEFARFVQTAAGETARMDFVLSFHQLSKRRPDCHQVRIIRVVVRIPSIAAAANFAGTLTHWGRFLVRDRTATLTDPEAVRLIPTPEQVEEALREQREKGTTRGRDRRCRALRAGPPARAVRRAVRGDQSVRRVHPGRVRGVRPGRRLGAGAAQRQHARHLRRDPHLRPGGGGRRDRAGDARSSRWSPPTSRSWPTGSSTARPWTG